MAEDFFKKDDLKEQIAEVMEPQDSQVEETSQTIKLGDSEYTQEELDRLVNLGKIGAEAEEKYGVKIDKIWPNHQRTINEKMELENKLKALEEARANTPVNADEADVEKQVRETLGKYGYKTEAEVRQIVQNEINGQKLINDTQATIDEMVEEGYPATNIDDLFAFMADPANPKNPRQAYKLMFEEQIDKVKEQKLRSLKSDSLVTNSSSTAGSKSPAPQKITKDNLRDSLMGMLPD